MGGGFRVKFDPLLHKIDQFCAHGGYGDPRREAEADRVAKAFGLNRVLNAQNVAFARRN